MIKKDLHVHTTFSDGVDTPEEVVKYAVENGFSEIGFSDHSTMPFDLSYCIKDEKPYRAEIERLKIKYADKIKILCGIEQDYYSGKADNYDYVIGSVHCFKFGEDYVPVDFKVQILLDAIEKYCNGDVYLLIEEYYKLVSNVVEVTGADIIGHFDLISKFNEKTPFFDENNPRYIKAWKSALDRLLPLNKPFEINTGGISRGYKTVPYPSSEMIKYIKDAGGKFILSSDSHNKETLLFGFDKIKV